MFDLWFDCWLRGKKYIAENQTEAQIVVHLDKLCTAFPGSFGKECETIVAAYVPRIIGYLEAGYPASVICQKIGLCPKILKRNVEQSGCSICTLVVTYVESYLSANQTEAEIIQQLDQLCADLPGSFGTECKSIVSAYVPQIITFLEAGYPANVVCSKIGLCTSNKKENTNYHSRDRRSIQQGGCSICELVVTYVEQFVQQNKTEAQIIAEVDQLCSLLPSPINGACDQFAAAYVPQLIQWIINKENPQQFCSQVGLCSSKKITQNKHLKLH